MRRLWTSLAIAVLCTVTTVVTAQGGRVDSFCEGKDNCVADTLEVHFGSKDGPSTLELGDAQDSFTAVLVTTTVSENVQGWSYGVKHDPAAFAVGDNPCAVAGDDFLCDTDANAARVPPSFNVSTSVGACGDGGPQGFISAVVLSFVAPAALSVGANSLAQVPYSVVDRAAIPAEGSVIEFVDNELCNAPSPPVAVNITIAGTAKLPAEITQGIVSAGGAPPEEDCSAEGDEDGNGLADCDDPVCADLPACEVAEDCDTAGDEDGNGLADCDDPACVCGDWSFSFGSEGGGAGGNTTINITNETNALAFQGGVSTAGGTLSFSGDLGTDNTRLVELLITDNEGNSHDASNGLAIGGDVDFAAEVTSLSRGAATEGFAAGDFFAFDLNPGVGGAGFTFGYVSDLDADTNQIPAGTNEVICINCEEAPKQFSRGDADGNGKINISDAVNIIQIVLGNIAERFNCDDAIDANDDGSTNITDALPVLGWIFLRGERLPEPFLACGADATDDDVTCEEDSPNCGN